MCRADAALWNVGGACCNIFRCACGVRHILPFSPGKHVSPRPHCITFHCLGEACKQNSVVYLSSFLWLTVAFASSSVLSSVFFSVPPAQWLTLRVQLRKNTFLRNTWSVYGTVVLFLLLQYNTIHDLKMPLKEQGSSWRRKVTFLNLQCLEQCWEVPDCERGLPKFPSRLLAGSDAPPHQSSSWGRGGVIGCPCRRSLYPAPLAAGPYTTYTKKNTDRTHVQYNWPSYKGELSRHKAKESSQLGRGPAGERRHRLPAQGTPNISEGFLACPVKREVCVHKMERGLKFTCKRFFCICLLYFQN